MRRAGSFAAPSLFCTARTEGGKEGGEGRGGKETVRAKDKKTAEEGDTEGGMERI